jgi:hypothetical protein
MDQYAQDCFEALGLKDIPEKTAKLYHRVKSARDTLAPGPLDADTFALIFALTVPEKTPPPPTPPPREG